MKLSLLYTYNMKWCLSIIDYNNNSINDNKKLTQKDLKYVLTNTKTTTHDKFSSAEGSPCRLVPSFEQTISSLDPTPN